MSPLVCTGVRQVLATSNASQGVGVRRPTTRAAPGPFAVPACIVWAGRRWPTHVLCADGAVVAGGVFARRFSQPWPRWWWGRPAARRCVRRQLPPWPSCTCASHRSMCPNAVARGAHSARAKSCGIWRRRAWRRRLRRRCRRAVVVCQPLAVTARTRNVSLTNFRPWFYHNRHLRVLCRTRSRHACLPTPCT